MSNLQTNLKLGSLKELSIVRRLQELLQDEVDRAVGTPSKSQALLTKDVEDKAQGKGKKKDQDEKKNDGPKNKKGSYYYGKPKHKEESWKQMDI